MLIKKTTHGTSEIGARDPQIWSRSINIFPLASCYPDTAARSPARFFISSRLCVKILLCLLRLYIFSSYLFSIFILLNSTRLVPAAPDINEISFMDRFSSSSRLVSATARRPTEMRRTRNTFRRNWFLLSVKQEKVFLG